MSPIARVFSGLLRPWAHAARVPSRALAARLDGLLREVGLHADRHSHALVRHMLLVDGAVYPEARDPDAALAALVYGLWVYLLDDTLDEADLADDPDRTRARLERAFAAVSGAPLPEDADGVDRLGAALHRLLVPAGAAWNARFLADVHDYLFRGSLPAAAARARGTAPTLAAYLQARTFDGAILPAARLVEHMLGVEAEDPRTDALRQLAARHVALANDLFSYEKEARRGSPWNLLAVLQAEGRSFEEAVGAAVRLLDADVVRFRELCLAGACDEAATDDAAYLAHALGGFIAGHLDFSLASARFRSARSPFAELRPIPYERAELALAEAS